MFFCDGKGNRFRHISLGDSCFSNVNFMLVDVSAVG